MAAGTGSPWLAECRRHCSRNPEAPNDRFEQAIGAARNVRQFCPPPTHLPPVTDPNTNRTLNSNRQPALTRHVSFVRICDCCIFRLLPHFSHVSVKCAYRVFFAHKLAFSTAILMLYYFSISIKCRYLSHLVANRMAPSMCLDPCGVVRFKQFCTIFSHISASYLVFMSFAYFLSAAQNWHAYLTRQRCGAGSTPTPLARWTRLGSASAVV